MTCFQLTISYTEPWQRYNGGPKGTILFGGFYGTIVGKYHAKCTYVGMFGKAIANKTLKQLRAKQTYRN